MDNDKLIKIFGTDELVSLFTELDSDNQNKILTTSFKKGAKIIISEAQNNLRGNFKHVYNALGTSMKKNIQVLNVGSIMKRGGYLAHLVNAGTKERAYRTKNGKMHRTGKMTANYFWDNALSSTESNVEEIIYLDIKDRFEKLLQKKMNNK